MQSFELPRLQPHYYCGVCSRTSIRTVEGTIGQSDPETGLFRFYQDPNDPERWLQCCPERRFRWVE